MKNIAIAGFQHETNTFAPSLANLEQFIMADSWPGLLLGEDVISGTKGINLPITGFINAADESKVCKLLPIVWCSAEPSSFVTSEAYEYIVNIIIEGISKIKDLDGIYLDLHGAMVTENFEDGEGELLNRIRKLVGPNLPISISLDFHANMTPEIAQLASSINIFRTYPHIDMADTGIRAFRSLFNIFAHGPLFRSFKQIPYLIPLHAQHTGSYPCDFLFSKINEQKIQFFN